MDIWQLDKIYLFIVFIIPGFIALKTYNLLFSSESVESGKQIIEAVTLSCINYSILFFPILFIENSSLKETYNNLYLIFYFFAVFVMPVLMMLVIKKVRQNEYIQGFIHNPHSGAWEFLFSQRKSYWVIVTLQNNDQIAGKFWGSSFASSRLAERKEIFIEEQWHLNAEGGFDRPYNSSEGVLIISGIKYIELFKNMEETNE